MYIGYVLNDGTLPLLKQITDNEAEAFVGDKPLLIVGYDKAVKLFPKQTKLTTRIIDDKKQIYYTFSREESEKKYSEQTSKFLKRTLGAITNKVAVTSIIDPERIDFSKLKGRKVFLHETSTLITISTIDHIYLFNKEVSFFFNEAELTTDYLTELLKNNEVWSWDRFKFFGARLKSNFAYKSKDQFRYLLEPYCDSELYMGVLCLHWLNELKEVEYEQVWQDAYEAEHLLSNLPVKIDKKQVLLLSYQSETTLFENILKQQDEGYVYQLYNGTDKTTGRMYAKGSGFSMQTLPENIRHIVVAEHGCYLVEFDYKYFEYSLLQQLCKIVRKGDPHKHLALDLFGDVSYRDVAKRINYGTIYGQSIPSIVNELVKEYQIDFNKSSLTERIEKLSQPFEELKLKLKEELELNGYVINPFGRFIIPEKNFAVLNNYVQSTAADIVIRKLLKIKRLLNSYNSLNRIVLQKHDSILFNLREIDIEQEDIARKIKEILEQPENDLFGKVTLKYGKNWRDLE